MRKKQCVAMLLAGGQGSRLGILTKDVAKPAVPYGGKYRIIDFPLSNCTNSGIDVVGVLTQYRPLELNAYIGSGSPWDLDLSNGGVYVLPPYQTGKTGEWYKGTANAIYQNIPFIAQWDPEYVLLLSGDVRRQLFPADRPVYTKVRDDLPTRYVEECECSNSLIANGCMIEGTVINSVLFRGVKVAKGAVVKNSIVMQDAQIQEGAEIDHCILDKQSVIRRNGRLIAPAAYPIVIAKNVVI